ncbi:MULTISPECIES: hypothetical protein [Okeania]|uniref:Uncharacterized protein n=1 Tax=Okeania hirsuta TaxID=1458930 RepID=A0A3N6NYE0_9CYAN|nr:MULTISPECIES: hypothetical protein [Okeania]NEP05918.1 hypothetical protein [Okeania sp. SIO4D6]NET17783.1 hypothetical protein [Okeania sp. SIO1H6]NEP72249.1 hypothetical protein [Okeania sp. SIO2G5]NEP89880.1 hypothetical protein [Okeania sp. SIO2C2]NEP94604.1 hypothetical protein [Okeania sp. SIO2F5]
MKRYLILSALASLGIFLQAGSANDQYRCNFRYKVGANDWVNDSASATTRSLAKGSVASVLESKEAKANREGKSFDSTNLFCREVLGD